MLFDCAALLFLGARVEPVWGVRAYVHFMSIVNLAVGLSTFVTMYVLYMVTRDQFYLFANFGGFHGIVAGLLVALRQLSPEDDVEIAPLRCLGLRNKHLCQARERTRPPFLIVPKVNNLDPSPFPSLFFR